MERKTIFRSSFAVVTMLAMASSAPLAVAQEGPRPASHTVKRGDTLWDIAGHYLGDPFLWPQIFRVNTDVVEDPHWIYPGEVLRLTAVEGSPAVPAEDTPAPPGAEGDSAAPAAGIGAEPDTEYEYPMPEFARRSPHASLVGLQTYVDRAYRPLRPGEFYSSGFLTEGQGLPYGRMLGPITPQQIRNLSERTSVTLYTQVGVTAPSGASYAAGDTLLVLQLGEEFRGFGLAVVPTGLVRLTGEVDHQYIGEVIAVYGPMRNGQLVLPAERFSPGPPRRAVPAGDGLRGAVIGTRELRELKHPQNILFIDVGRSDGVAPGDVFEIRREPGPRPNAADQINELMASGQVVRVGDRSATLVLIEIVSPDIPPGTPVLRVARLPEAADR